METVADVQIECRLGMFHNSTGLKPAVSLSLLAAECFGLKRCDEMMTYCRPFGYVYFL